MIMKKILRKIQNWTYWKASVDSYNVCSLYFLIKIRNKKDRADFMCISSYGEKKVGDRVFIIL